jgi:hypothetical protein
LPNNYGTIIGTITSALYILIHNHDCFNLDFALDNLIRKKTTTTPSLRAGAQIEKYKLTMVARNLKL